MNPHPKERHSQINQKRQGHNSNGMITTTIDRTDIHGEISKRYKYYRNVIHSACVNNQKQICTCYLLGILTQNKSEDQSTSCRKFIQDQISKFKLFYVDICRYEPFVRESILNLKNQNQWKQLIYCLKSRIHIRTYYNHIAYSRNQSNKNLLFIILDRLKLLSHIHLFWIRKRQHFPFYKIIPSLQWVNHIPSEYLITQKHHLATNIIQFWKNNQLWWYNWIQDKKLPHPITFNLGNPSIFHHFIDIIQKKQSIYGDQYWIIKPSKSSGGRGIFIINGLSDFIDKFSSRFKSNGEFINNKTSDTHHNQKDQDRDRNIPMKNKNNILKITDYESLKTYLHMRSVYMFDYIGQKYLSKPLLLNGYKFDIRAYLLITSTKPLIAFYHDGYLRINIEKYNLDEINNTYAHISNIGIQRKHPDFEKKKFKAKWSFSKFQSYLLEKGLTTDPHFLEDIFKVKLRKLIACALESVRHRIVSLNSHFGLIGVDYLVDEKDLRPWLIEFTKTPAAHAGFKGEGFMPQMIDECLKLVIETEHKRRNSQTLDSKTTFKSLNSWYRIEFDEKNQSNLKYQT